MKMTEPANRRVHHAVTDNKGRASFSNLPEGEYTFEMSKEGYIPVRKNIMVPSGNDNVEIQVGLRAISKSTLKQENERLRGVIAASTRLDQIDSCVSDSQDMIELSPVSFRKEALKQFRKTSKAAHDRIEELRLGKRSTGVSVSLRDLKGSFQWSTNKKPTV
jgi:hypothetical protein